MKKIFNGVIYYIDTTSFDNQRRFTPVLIIENENNSELVKCVPIYKKQHKGRNKKTHIKVKQFSNIRPNSIIDLEDIKYVNINELKGYIDILNQTQMEEVERLLQILSDVANEYSNLTRHSLK